MMRWKNDIGRIILEMQREISGLLIAVKELNENKMRLKQENIFSQEREKRLKAQIEKNEKLS